MWDSKVQPGILGLGLGLGQFHLHSKYEANLGYMRQCLKTKRIFFSELEIAQC